MTTATWTGTRPQMDASAIRADGLEKAFGGAQAVAGATFDVPQATVTALIGPNGAGKTTVVNMLAGSLQPDSGSVLLSGNDVTSVPRHVRAQRGLIRTFQLSRELGGLTVLENLLVARTNQAGERLFNVFFRPQLIRREERVLTEIAAGILHTYGLYELRDARARELSGGQKRLLEIARAVMAEPTVLLLDEPMAGINPALIDQIGQHILDLKTNGVTVLMVEHNLGIVEQMCDQVIVLAEGRTLATGRMSDLREDTAVVRAYLGGVLDARLDS